MFWLLHELPSLIPFLVRALREKRHHKILSTVAAVGMKGARAGTAQMLIMTRSGAVTRVFTKITTPPVLSNQTLSCKASSAATTTTASAATATMIRFERITHNTVIRVIYLHLQTKTVEVTGAKMMVRLILPHHTGVLSYQIRQTHL